MSGTGSHQPLSAEASVLQVSMTTRVVATHLPWNAM